MPTEERFQKVSRVLSQRQPDLRVVLEGVTIPHNASAVVRTCDAAGILNLDLLSPEPETIIFNEAITTGAEKWLNIKIHKTAAECFPFLKTAGFTVAAVHLDERGISYVDFDYAKPVVLVFGNESTGVSEEALSYADQIIKIPMLGMVQSLNLSVSVAVVVFEAIRQRRQKGFFERARLSASDLDLLRKKWLRLPLD